MNPNSKLYPLYENKFTALCQCDECKGRSFSDTDICIIYDDKNRDYYQYTISYLMKKMPSINIKEGITPHILCFEAFQSIYIGEGQYYSSKIGYIKICGICQIELSHIDCNNKLVYSFKQVDNKVVDKFYAYRNEINFRDWLKIVPIQISH